MAMTSGEITHNDVRSVMYEFLHKWQQPSDHMHLEEADTDAIRNRMQRRSSGNRTQPSQLKQWIHDLQFKAWGNTYTNRMLPFLYNIPLRVWKSDMSNVGFQQREYIDLIPEDYDWRRVDGFIELVNIDNGHYRSVVHMEGIERSMPKKSMDKDDNGVTLLAPENASMGPVKPSPRYDFKVL